VALLKPDATTQSPTGAKAKPPVASNLTLLRRFWPYARADWRWLLAGLTAVPLMSLTGLAQPWLLKDAIDGPIAHGGAQADGKTLSQISLLFLASVIGEYVLRGGQLYALQLVGYRALERMRRDVFASILGQGMGFFDKRSTGTLLSRSTNDVEALAECWPLAWSASSATSSTSSRSWARCWCSTST